MDPVVRRARRADLVISVENVHQEQHLPDELTYLTIEHHACTDHRDLVCTGSLRREDAIVGWYANPRMTTITVASPDYTGAEPFKTVAAVLRTGFVGEYRDGLTRPEAESHTAMTGVRYDNAGPKLGSGKHKGTVFTDHQPVFPLSLSDQAVDEEARHVDHALNHSERTFPSLTGKNVPGASTERPLHRLMEENLKAQNHAASVRICRDVWGDTYTTDGLECDEYPFQSTYEGFPPPRTATRSPGRDPRGPSTAVTTVAAAPLWASSTAKTGSWTRTPSASPSSHDPTNHSA